MSQRVLASGGLSGNRLFLLAPQLPGILEAKSVFGKGE